MKGLDRLALVAAVLGLGGAAVGTLVAGPQAFFPAYLVAAIFWIEIAFGSLGLQMLHAVTSGGWGMLGRRSFYAASSTMPVLALLFAPIVVGLRTLYPWARPETVAHDHLLQHKAPYLNATFFIGRSGFYFVLWSALSLAIWARGTRKGKPGSLRMIAGPGILACGLTMTFAAMDWMMSLDPHWVSTVFGLLVIVGSLLSAMAFTIVVVTSDESSELPIDRLHDLGNLLMVFTMLWAYLSFSQYLIIYAGNMGEEVPFYVHRSAGGWQHLALGLIVLHFTVPFSVLISRRTKRSPKTLRVVALGILFMRLVELFWFTAPNFYGHHLHVSLLDVAAPVGVGGLWLLWFSRRYKALAGTPVAVRVP